MSRLRLQLLSQAGHVALSLLLLLLPSVPIAVASCAHLQLVHYHLTPPIYVFGATTPTYGGHFSSSSLVSFTTLRVSVMQPKVKLTPRKIGVQGPSIRRKESTKTPQFSREELSELRRLSAMLPPRAAREQDPAKLVLNAANYIQQLVATVRARVNKGTLPVEALAALPSGSTTPTRVSRKKRRSIEKRH